MSRKARFGFFFSGTIASPTSSAQMARSKYSASSTPPSISTAISDQANISLWRPLRLNPLSNNSAPYSDSGVDRTLAWITGEKHVRQCIAFPRMMDKVYI